MLRPSRPMIRPFISSLGSSTSRVVALADCVAARRAIATERMLRARRSASMLGLLLDLLQARGRPVLAPRARRRRSAAARACAAVRPETRSSSRRCTRLACLSSSAARSRFRSRSSSACVRRSSSASRTSSERSSRRARSSMRAISSRRARSSSAIPSAAGCWRRLVVARPSPGQPQGALSHRFLSPARAGRPRLPLSGGRRDRRGRAAKAPLSASARGWPRATCSPAQRRRIGSSPLGSSGSGVKVSAVRGDLGRPSAAA